MLVEIEIDLGPIRACPDVVAALIEFESQWARALSMYPFDLTRSQARAMAFAKLGWIEGICRAFSGGSDRPRMMN